MTIRLLPYWAPEADWLAARRAGIGASEIAAVCGISPYDSPFSLWWRKHNGWDSEPNDEMRVGKFLEPTIADWFSEFYNGDPDWVISSAGLYASSERPWQLATPDRLIQLDGHTTALLECKWVAASWDGWGVEGTDDVPVHYRAQCLWQMDVMGVDEVFLCALGPGGFRVYRIRRDERDLELMREEARRFRASLERGEQPGVDEHAATARTLKALHPTVEDIDIEVPVEFAEGYRRARNLAARAAALVDRYDARARQLLGNGRRLVVGKKLVVSRSVYDQSGDNAELLALDGEWPTTDRLNPGRAKSYV